MLDAGRPEGRGVDVDVGLLGWIFWGAAVGGLVAVVVAFAVPRRRRSFLIGAAVLFLVAGVLGILSFGIVLIVLSAACAVGAWRTRSREESRVP